MIVAGGALLAAPAARAQGEMIEYWIDESRSSANQDSRIRTLVFHYTAEDFATSLKLLTEPQYRTSAHYLVPDAATLSRRPAILRLVEEERRAWHAGDSYWRGQRYLNGASIGVEIVNRGYPSPLQDDWPPMRRDWQAFDDAQIAQVGKLAAGIVARHRIQPCDVVGHADIAPGRKMDRGRSFPGSDCTGSSASAPGRILTMSAVSWRCNRERRMRRAGSGGWPPMATMRRGAANGTRKPGTPSRRSRCIFARRVTTACRTRNRRRFWMRCWTSISARSRAAKRESIPEKGPRRGHSSPVVYSSLTVTDVTRSAVYGGGGGL